MRAHEEALKPIFVQLRDGLTSLHDACGDQDGKEVLFSQSDLGIDVPELGDVESPVYASDGHEDPQ